MTGRSILDGLNEASKAGIKSLPSARFRTKEIPIWNIYRNRLNGYSVENIKELARAILVAGRLYHNLVVVYDPDPETGAEYRLVSGERRWRALHILTDEGHHNFALATCQIVPKGTEAEERVAVILANSQREKTAGDRVQEYEGLKKSLKEMRAAGHDLYGRDLKEGTLRDHMAAIMEESAGTLAAMEKISRNLSPELRELMDAGRITFTGATAAADLTPEQQEELAAAASAKPSSVINKRDVQNVEESHIKTAREQLEESYRQQDCMISPGGCSNAANLASFYKDGSTAGCVGCCAVCNRSQDCPKCCDKVRQKMQQATQEAAESPQHTQANVQPGGTKTPAETRTEADAPFMDDAAPRYAETLCYSCAHWEECSERSDKTLTCNRYHNPAEHQEPLTAEMKTYQATSDQAMRTDDQLLDVLRGAVDTLADDGMINERERGRLEDLLAAMTRRWINTGRWKPYGEAEEQDERERVKSQDVNN